MNAKINRMYYCVREYFMMMVLHCFGLLRYCTLRLISTKSLLNLFMGRNLFSSRRFQCLFSVKKPFGFGIEYTRTVRVVFR
jgi:hypothetical protein